MNANRAPAAVKSIQDRSPLVLLRTLSTPDPDQFRTLLRYTVSSVSDPEVHLDADVTMKYERMHIVESSRTLFLPQTSCLSVSLQLPTSDNFQLLRTSSYKEHSPLGLCSTKHMVNFISDKQWDFVTSLYSAHYYYLVVIMIYRHVFLARTLRVF